MNRFLRPLACISLLALASCGGNIVPVAAIAPAAIPADQLAKVQSVCAKAGPVLAVASAPSLPAVVKETAVYGAAFCSAINAGRVPPTADSNSANWLSHIVDELPSVARAAGVVLPMLL